MKTPVRCLATEIPLDRRGKREGNISHAFTSFSGKKAAPLPERYRLLKKNLTAGREETLQKSWDDLVEVLKERTEEVATKREKVGTKPGLRTTYSTQAGSIRVWEGR
jgi:hypothetical protein